MDIVLAALGGASIITAATLLAWRGWLERGISAPWPLAAIAAGQLVAGTVGATLAYRVLPVLPPGVIFALAAALALGVTAILTDISSSKIPKEPCLAAILAGLVGYFASGGTEMWGTFNVVAALLGLVAAPFLAAIITKGGLGFGDIRLLAAYATTLSWWVQVEPLLWGVLSACAIQGLVRMATRLKHTPKLPFGPALVAGITAWTAFTVLMA